VKGPSWRERFEAIRKNLVTRWLGYDVFLSYTHRDARDYTLRFQHELETGHGFVCFRDASELAAGDELDDRIKAALGRTRMLVIVGSPESRNSSYIGKEIDAFDARKPLVGIDIGGSLPLDLWPKLAQRIRLLETIEAFRAGLPSPGCVLGVNGAATSQRVRTLAKRLTLIVTAAVVMLVAGAGVAIWRAWAERIEKDRQARIALAQSLAAEAVRQDGVLGVLLAIEGWRLNEEARGLATKDVDEALRNVLKSQRLRNQLAVQDPVAAEPMDIDPTGAWALTRHDGAWRLLKRDDRQLVAAGKPATAARALLSRNGTVVRWSDDATILRAPADGGRAESIKVPGATIGSVAVGDDGRALAVMSEARLYYVRPGQDPGLQLVRDFGSGFHQVVVTISDSGRRIAAAQLVGDRINVFVWDVAPDGRIGPPRNPRGDLGNVEGLNRIVLSPSAKYLVVTSIVAESSGPAFLWDLDSSAAALEVRGKGETFESVAFTSDETRMALGTHSYGVDSISYKTAIEFLDVWQFFNSTDGRRGKVLASVPCEHDTISLLRFSTDGERLLAVDGNIVRLFDELWWRPKQRRMWAHDRPVVSAAWTNDGRTVLTATRDGSFFEWDAMPPPAEPRVAAVHNSGHFFPIAVDSAGRIVAGGYGRIRMWDTRKAGDPRNPQLESDIGAGNLTSVAFVGDGQSVVGGHSDGRVLYWKNGLGAPTVIGKHENLDAAVFVRTVPDVDTVLSGGADGTVRAWSLDGKEEWTVDRPGKPVAALAVQRRGDLGAWAAGKSVRVGPWRRPSTGEIVERAFDEEVTALAIAAGALFVGQADGTVLREPLGGRESRTRLGQHVKSITAVALDPTERWLATGDPTGVVRVWDLVQGGAPVVLSESKHPTMDLVFSADSRWVISSGQVMSDGADGILEGPILLRPTTPHLVNLAELAVWRNLSCSEWRKFVGASMRYHRTFASLPLPGDLSVCE
jgi:WD40 repeat protein